MKAAFVAVGSELLGSDRVDTNSLRLAEVLAEHDVPLVHKAVVGDDEAAIAEELRRHLASGIELVVVSGGLGPTADDVTRQAVAGALGRELYHDPEIAELIARRFREHGITMPEVNRRQAEVVEGAEVITNPRGTAPGMVLEHLGEHGGATLFVLPGVPWELEGMIGSHLHPFLARTAGGRRRETRTLKIAGLPESTVEERIAPAYEDFGRESITVLAAPGEIRVRFTASGDEPQRRRSLDAMEERLATLVGPAVFARREDDTLESVVGELLRRRGSTVVCAESCTGGLVAERLTRVAGSSDYFPGGLVTYSNALKEQLLGVPAAVLAEHGAVSEAVARAMAVGVRQRLKGDYGIAVTGIAGPGGGSEDKPVGTVHLAVASAAATDHRRVRFPGDRERVRRQSAQLVLEMLRRRLLEDLGERAGGGPHGGEPPGGAR